MSLASKASFVVADWTLDEVSGTRTDLVNSYTLTDHNTVVSNTGLLGNAADFTLSNSEYLSRTINSNLAGADVKLMLRCWVKLKTKATLQVLMASQDDGTNNTAYALYYHSILDKFMFSVSPDGTAGAATTVQSSLTPISTGSWYLIHAWHDSVGNLIGISVNGGTADTAAHSTGIFNGNADFSLGCTFTSGVATNFLDALLDEVLVMRGDFLDATERSDDYNNQYGVRYTDWDQSESFTEQAPLVAAAWNMDEVSGTRASQAGSETLTDNNTVTSGTGIIGNAAQFTQANSEYLSHASDATLQMGDIDFMIRCWVKPTVAGLSGTGSIVAKDTDSPANSRDYTLDIAGGFIRWYVNGGVSGLTTWPSSLVAGTWYLIHAWHDSVNDRLYLDINASEAIAVSTTGAVPNTSGAEFRIGARAYTGFLDYFDGMIDEVLLMKNSHLTVSQRRADYNSGAGTRFVDWGATVTARLGVFDTQLRGDLWFADDLAILSWFDRDLVDTSSIYTATVACTVGAATTSASATFSPGTKTATAACTVGRATTSGTATFVVPTYHGTAACTVGHATTAGVATFTVPTYHGTAACTVGHATTSASATFVAPVYTATAACTVGHATTSGSATFVGPTYQATAACTVGHATTSGSATFSPGVHTATAACTVGHATTSGSATFAPGTHTAAATCVVGHATTSGSATFSAGVHTATAAVTVGHATANGSATFTGPVYTGSAAVTIGHVTAAATGIFATIVRSASAVCTVGRATANATASFTVPTYQGSAACTVGHATCAGAGTFFSTYHGSAVCTTGKVTTSGSATFTLPTRTATAALIAPHALCSGAALVLNPFYDASAACTIGPIIVSAAGLFTLGLGLPAIILPVVLARGTLVLQVPGRRRATSAVAEVRGALRLPTAILGE